MNNRHIKTKALLLIGVISAITTFGIGQTKYIDLEEALSIARKNYAGLQRDRLAVDQQNKLAQIGLLSPPAQLYLSGEEFGVNNQSGVHSINVQQNFFLPNASKVQRAYYQRNAALAGKQLALTEHELKRQVGQAYYNLLYAKQEQELVTENLALYNNFVSVTAAQLESGETGRIPKLAARSHLSQAQLDEKYAFERYQIALTLFNQWLQSDTAYNVQRSVVFNPAIPLDLTIQNNPHLQIIQAQRDLANAKVETEKALLLPQINSGFKLQTVAGNFPLFAYQIGVNVPLFKKAYYGRIEAAQVGVKVQEADLKVREQ